MKIRIGLMAILAAVVSAAMVAASANAASQQTVAAR